jgi:hypothetical protein
VAQLAAIGEGSRDQLHGGRQYDWAGGGFGLGELLLEALEEGSFLGGGGLGVGGVT